MTQSELARFIRKTITKQQTTSQTTLYAFFYYAIFDLQFDFTFQLKFRRLCILLLYFSYSNYYCLCSNELQTIIRTACLKHRTRTATCSRTLPKRIIWQRYHDNNNSCINLAAALALMILTILDLAVVVGCPHDKDRGRRHHRAICRPCSRSHHSPA